MHLPDSTTLAHIWSALKALYRLCRYAYGAITNRLRDSGEEFARTAPTASVIRGSRLPLRWYQWPMARRLQRAGHGIIRNGCYETWVNVTPPGVVMAMQMRATFQPHHRNWGNGD
jgi:hypothetical protein